MSSTEKELEERLTEVGNSLLAPPTEVEEILHLLDKAESLLSMVEQSPSKLVTIALHPVMKGLVEKGLFGHLHEDVKVAVASCISEITRITAPEAPYDDDLMKDIFKMIVDAFERLDDMSSRSYSKRVSILETVAKVRSCVVMLDLECDDLILEMFNHFVSTIRDNHPPNVFASMEMIMVLVLEESEDISPDLVSVLLTNVKRDAKDILPIAQRLAEKVIADCAIKLKPCLVEALKSSHGQLSDYSRIVTLVCEESSDVLENNGLNASGECVADDSKFSERTVSDELVQGSGKIESEVSCPEVGTASGRSPKSVMSNGIVMSKNDSLAEPISPKRKSQLPQLINRKSKGLKDNSAHQLTIKDANYEVAKERRGANLSKRKKRKDYITKKEHSKGINSKEKFKKKASLVSSSSNEKLPDASRPRRGRPPGVKSKPRGAGNAPVSPSSSHKPMVIEDTDTEILFSFKKRKKGTKESGRKPGRPPGKKHIVEDSGISHSHRKSEVDAASDEDGRLLRKRRKLHMEGNEDGSTSGKRQGRKIKPQKIRDSLDDVVSSSMMTVKGDEDQAILEESKPRKKRVREEITKAPGYALKFDESLIGAEVQVWWPIDMRFYSGTIASYSPTKKKHKVVYFDGDVEFLSLKDERFKFIDDAMEERHNSCSKDDTEMSGKKARRSRGSTKSDPGGLHGDSDFKKSRRGRKPKFADGSVPSRSKSAKINGKLSIDSPKSGSVSKNKLRNSTDEISEAAPKLKPGRKPKAGKTIGSSSKAYSFGSRDDKDIEGRIGKVRRGGRPGRKSKEEDTPRSVKKLKSASKSDNGSKFDDVKDKFSSARGQDGEDDAPIMKSQDSEGRSEKKRTKKVQD